MFTSEQNLHASPKLSLENISVLLVSPDADDQAALKQILHNDGWQLRRCNSVDEADGHIQNRAPSIVVCERDLPDGTWKDLLARTQSAGHAVPLLVISRHADENLWGEVLNLGGYDVLLKPFDRAEVTRVLAMAWRQWFRPSAPRPEQHRI